VRSKIGGVTGDGFDMHRPVWVKLNLVFPRPSDRPVPEQLFHQHAIDVTVEVPGELLQWLRTSTGEWLGLVTFQLPFADGRHGRVFLERQLLPSYALRPRKYGSHRQ
jgi:hypothetical protein